MSMRYLWLCLSELIPPSALSFSFKLVSESLLDAPGPKDCITKQYGQQAFIYIALSSGMPCQGASGKLTLLSSLLSRCTSFTVACNYPSHVCVCVCVCVCVVLFTVHMCGNVCFFLPSPSAMHMHFILVWKFVMRIRNFCSVIHSHRVRTQLPGQEKTTWKLLLLQNYPWYNPLWLTGLKASTN